MIRPAVPGDEILLLSFIRALADYENLSSEVSATPGDIRNALFGEKPCAEALIAFWEGKPAGFAVFFSHFSTFLGKPGLYLEDLFVKPEFRGRGIGKAILARLAGMADRRDCGRFEWAVLEWNRNAIDFYLSIGARPLADWRIFRMSRENLKKLAGSA
ncbi:GNAT family N-acetyltransferase [bacterium]|nr:GNAT family N-acetyltransferase [bacterium]